MKRFVPILILIALFAVSCDNRLEEDIFPNTPTERVANAISEYKSLLSSSPEGWYLEYYPGGREREYGGYTYTLKFTETEVTAMVEHAISLPDAFTTKYNIIPNAGPTLTFDDYNRVLHFLATPTQLSYNAFLADYEFLILSHENDVITLKGKKYGSKMKLRKLTENMEVYLNKVSNLLSRLQQKEFVKFVVKGKDINFTTSPRIITYTYDENGTLKTENMAYAYTDRGIRFYEPIVIDGVTIEELIFNEADSSLDLADGTQIILLSKDLPIDLKTLTWNIELNSANTSQLFNQTFMQIFIQNNTVYGEFLDPSFKIGYVDDTSTSMGITFRSYEPSTGDTYQAVKGINFHGTANDGEVGMALGRNGLNWNFYEHLSPMVELIVNNAPYAVEIDDPNNPTRVKFTSIQNSEMWFFITR